MKKYISLLICALILTACGQTVPAETETAVPTEASSEETTTESSAETTTESTTTETTTESTTTETTTEFTQREVPFEDTAENAYERLMASFETEYGVVYPEDYGGVYSYAGILFVNITENTPPESYTAVLGEHTCVKYQTVKHSFNRLTEICLEAKELLDTEFGVDEYYVDVPGNTAAVTIINGDPKKAQNHLKTITDKSFTLDELAISMAEPKEEN